MPWTRIPSTSAPRAPGCAPSPPGASHTPARAAPAVGPGRGRAIRRRTEGGLGAPLHVARRFRPSGRNIPSSGPGLDVCSVAERARLRDALRAGSEGGVPKAHPSTSRLHRSGRSRIESAPPAARTTPSAPTWHVPLPVLSGPPGSRLRAASAFPVPSSHCRSGPSWADVELARSAREAPLPATRGSSGADRRRSDRSGR